MSVNFILLFFLNILFHSWQLFDIVWRYDTLLNVLKSVTQNLKSILLTAVLAVILIYLYSILGYLFFRQDFYMPTNPIAESDGYCEGGMEQFA